MKIKNNYDIIHIRDYYPSKENPASSPWVYDQVKGIQDFNLRSLVISPTPYIPAFIRNRDKYYLYPKYSNKIEKYIDTDVIRPPYLKIPNNKLVPLTFFFLSNSILKVISKVPKPVLIHAHFGQNGIASVNIKRKYGIPLITSFYGYDSGRLGQKFKPFYNTLIKYGDIFLALSQDMKKDLLNLGFPKNKILIHHLGIELDKFKKIKKGKKNRFIFLVVARFNESKGIQNVIRAFSMILRNNMELRIVGDGIFKRNLVDLVDELKIRNIRFINNFKANNPRGVVLEEMQNCDVFLLTSFTPKNKAKEGTPVVLMEAQACAKPCIATFHAGMPEVVKNKETGFLVKERDVNSISKYMKYFYDNPDISEKMGENARNHIFKNFNQKLQIEKLYSIYNNLINCTNGVK